MEGRKWKEIKVWYTKVRDFEYKEDVCKRCVSSWGVNEVSPNAE
jgi:hypothetical protein